MPERQSSPGEVTARPDADPTENGDGHREMPHPDAEMTPAEPDGARDAPVAGGSGQPEASGSAAAADVPEQVADQVAAEPEASEPGPARPGDHPPPAEAPVADAEELTAVAEPAATPVATDGGSTPGAGPVGAPADRDRGPVGGSGDAGSAGRPGPGAVQQAPAEEAPAAGPGLAVPPDPSTMATPPRPSPRPRPAEPTASASPAVSVAERGAGAAPAAEPTAPPTDDATPADAAPADAAPADAAPADAARADAEQADAEQADPERADPEQAVDGGPTVVLRAAGPGEAAQAASEGSDSWFATRATRIPPASTVDPVDSAAAGAATVRLPVGGPAADGATATGPPPPDAAPPESTDDPAPPRRSRRRLLLIGGMLVVLALLYVGDLAFSAGSVPRGVTVAGVPVGGIGLAEADQRLRAELGPRTTQPVAVTVGEARSVIDPATAGLAVDWVATLDQVGAQPLNPIARIMSFFTGREIGVVTSTDRPALDAALAELAPVVDKPPVEGSVRFEGTTPAPVEPVAGQQLDLAAAAEVLRRNWARGGAVALPLIELAPTTTPEDVATAIEEVARPAVSGPVTVAGEGGTQGTVTPAVIATALSFRADPAEGLVPEINQAAISEALEPQLAASERPGRDATLDFASGAPVVVPSQDGRGVDYAATLKDLLTVLTGTGPRQITAVYADQPAELTTDELNALGITGVIGEFTTRGFKVDSGRNIRRAAEVINGMIVEPGETFSLNGATAPRNAANGYIEAGIINDGHPSRGIGGGVSQLATTLYNAAYFAGMVDVAHKEHSFYISRYPPGREATVFEGSIDLKFRNDNPTGLLIQTAWTPESITVRLYGTKRHEVTSTPGPRTNPTSPNTVTIPAGEPCSTSSGAPGFTITDTRTLREISTGQVRTETRSVRYNPSPIVKCGG